MRGCAILMGFFFLLTACSPEEEESDTLSVSWNKIPGYFFYVFAPQSGAAFSTKEDFKLQEDESTCSYPWQGKDIGLYAVALPRRTVAAGMYPETDAQGHLYIKHNGNIQSLSEHDLLIAAPQKVAVRKAKTAIHFRYGMSLGSVELKLDHGLDGYVFNIRMGNLIRDGYIDLSQGIVVAGNDVDDSYFSQRGTSSAYDLSFVPQSVERQVKISILGMRNMGVDKPLAYELLVDVQEFLPAWQYTWTFSVTSKEITYNGFQKKERRL